MQLYETMQANLAQAFHPMNSWEGNEENTPPPINSVNSVTIDKLFVLLQDLQTQVESVAKENKLLKRRNPN